VIYKPSNRLRDAALIAPIGGVIVFLPPYVRIFAQDGTILGVPFLHVSLFASWFFGIALTGFLARRLIRSAVDDDDAETHAAADAEPQTAAHAETPAAPARGRD
jgi:hypothetical protein